MSKKLILPLSAVQMVEDVHRVGIKEGKMERDESHSNGKLLRVLEVSEICTISVRKIWRDVAANLFPQPIKLGAKTTRWWESDTVRFLRGEWKP